MHCSSGCKERYALPSRETIKNLSRNLALVTGQQL
jgi:hypothetical protein